MTYVQGFVTPVPNARRQEYIDVARGFFTMLRDYGALRHVEAWGEDVPDGKVTDFRRAVAAEADEAVVLAWIVWPDRETCDAAAAKMGDDPRMEALSEMPFDARRMILGGFAPVYDSDGEFTAAA